MAQTVIDLEENFLAVLRRLFLEQIELAIRNGILVIIFFSSRQGNQFGREIGFLTVIASSTDQIAAFGEEGG